MSEFTYRERLEMERCAYSRVLDTITRLYIGLLEQETLSRSESEVKDYLAERLNYLAAQWVDLETTIQKLPPIIDVTLPQLARATSASRETD